MLLTTQHLEEAEQLADRLAILHHGRIIVDGTLAELKRLLPSATVEYVERQPTLEDVFLSLVSSAFVPTDTMPGPVRAFAENQPATAIVDTIRGLVTGQPGGDGIAVALTWCVVILVVAYTLATAVYRRKVG